MNFTKIFNQKKIILAFVIFLGLFFRLHELGQTPKEYYWDEMAMMVDVRSIVETGFDMHGDSWLQPIFPSYSDYKAPVFIWFASASSLIFGTTGWSLRFVSVLAWVITLSCGFLLIHYLPEENKQRKINLQLSFALVLGFIPWSFHFSRVGFEAFLSQALLVASMTAGILAFRKKKLSSNTLLLILSSVFLGSLSSYTYFGTRYVWPILFLLEMIIFGIMPRFSKKEIKNLLKVLLVTIVSLGLFSLALRPLIDSPYYEISQRYRLSTKSIVGFQERLNNVYKSNSWKETAGNTFFDRIIFHRQEFFVHDFLENVSDHISIDFLFLSGDSNLRHGTGRHGLLLLSLFPALIAGLVLIFTRNFKVWTFLLLWFLVALIPASVPEETPHALRSLNGLMPLAIFVSYGLAYWPKRLRLQKIYLGIVVINIVLYLNYYFTQYSQSSFVSWQGEYPSIVKVIQHNRLKGEKVLIDFPDQKLFLWFLNDGDYRAPEIQAFEFDNFQLDNFDGIIFSNWQPREIREISNYSLLFIPKGEVSQTESEAVAQLKLRRKLKESGMLESMEDFKIPLGIEKLENIEVNGAEYALVRPYY